MPDEGPQQALLVGARRLGGRHREVVLVGGQVLVALHRDGHRSRGASVEALLDGPDPAGAHHLEQPGAVEDADVVRHRSLRPAGRPAAISATDAARSASSPMIVVRRGWASARTCSARVRTSRSARSCPGGGRSDGLASASLGWRSITDETTVADQSTFPDHWRRHGRGRAVPPRAGAHRRACAGSPTSCGPTATPCTPPTSSTGATFDSIDEGFAALRAAGRRGRRRVGRRAGRRPARGARLRRHLARRHAGPAPGADPARRDRCGAARGVRPGSAVRRRVAGGRPGAGARHGARPVLRARGRRRRRPRARRDRPTTASCSSTPATSTSSPTPRCPRTTRRPPRRSSSACSAFWRGSDPPGLGVRTTASERRIRRYRRRGARRSALPARPRGRQVSPRRRLDHRRGRRRARGRRASRRAP